MYEKLRRHPKRIVFPEGEDPRVLRAASEAARREILA
ncbi:MAG: phosphate acyltransferase, partial [Verrucomicrobiales bacterium]